MSLKSEILLGLPFNERELGTLVVSAPRRYKEYYIRKRNGQPRLIAQPTPEIKLLQRWLVRNYLSKFPVHAAATAYRECVGLAQNVQPHVNNRYMLKLDFRNFFPSLKSSDLLYFFRDVALDPEDAYLLTQILFKKGDGLELAVGAPSSPHLSNVLMFDFDTKMADYCEAKEIAYTRYADDLTYSCSAPHVLRECLEFVKETLRVQASPRLLLNEAKTVETSKKRGRRVTGLIITSDGLVSVGRERKRLLRAQVHRFSKGQLSPVEVEALRGYLAFLQSVEPDHMDRLAQSFGAELIASISRGG